MKEIIKNYTSTKEFKSLVDKKVKKLKGILITNMPHNVFNKALIECKILPNLNLEEEKIQKEVEYVLVKETFNKILKCYDEI